MPLHLTVEECLRAIRERDGEIHAWVEVAPRGAGEGELAGVPFGAKDIFETVGMLTQYGSPLFEGRRGVSDAALVKLLCDRGAVLLGKTHTTAFAYYDPAPTRNPHNPNYTPGGSSSGSAAAVAAGMCAFAIGTQTQGSVLRPASFCGVCGFKPGHGVLPLDGCLAFAPTLDTAGLFTATAADMIELWRRMGFRKKSTPAWRMGVFEDPLLSDAVSRLRAAGVLAESLAPPGEFEKLPAVVTIVNEYEGARTHEALWRKHGGAVGAKLAALVERGLAIPETQYLAAIAQLGVAAEVMDRLFAEHPVLLTPASAGPAPAGLASTGDPRYNAPWTGLGVPAISIPMPVGGMPVGLQLTAARGKEALLLATASAVEKLWQNEAHD